MPCCANLHHPRCCGRGRRRASGHPPEDQVVRDRHDGSARSDKYVGFHVELCQRALADIQKQLGLPKLDVRYQVVKSSNRIPLLQNGTIDIECGSTTNNAVRQQQVSFAVTTYVEEIRIAVRANSGIQQSRSLPAARWLRRRHDERAVVAQARKGERR